MKVGKCQPEVLGPEQRVEDVNIENREWEAWLVKLEPEWIWNDRYYRPSSVGSIFIQMSEFLSGRSKGAHKTIRMITVSVTEHPSKTFQSPSWLKKPSARWVTWCDKKKCKHSDTIFHMWVGQFC
jgi:hypothetical protein